MRFKHLKRRQSGFTLLELVVVVAVLVILAGFVLPKLDLFQLKANKGVAAANMSGTSRYIQQYRIQNNVYPDNWDSLMDNTGTALWVPGDPSGAPGVDPQLTGGGTGGLPAGSPHKLVATTVGTAYLRSITRMGIGHVLDA